MYDENVEFYVENIEGHLANILHKARSVAWPGMDREGKEDEEKDESDEDGNTNDVASPIAMSDISSPVGISPTLAEKSRLESESESNVEDGVQHSSASEFSTADSYGNADSNSYNYINARSSSGQRYATVAGRDARIRKKIKHNRDVQMMTEMSDVPIRNFVADCRTKLYNYVQEWVRKSPRSTLQTRFRDACTTWSAKATFVSETDPVGEQKRCRQFARWLVQEVVPMTSKQQRIERAQEKMNRKQKGLPPTESMIILELPGLSRKKSETDNKITTGLLEEMKERKEYNGMKKTILLSHKSNSNSLLNTYVDIDADSDSNTNSKSNRLPQSQSTIIGSGSAGSGSGSGPGSAPTAGSIPPAITIKPSDAIIPSPDLFPERVPYPGGAVVSTIGSPSTVLKKRKELGLLPTELDSPEMLIAGQIDELTQGCRRLCKKRFGKEDARCQNPVAPHGLEELMEKHEEVERKVYKETLKRKRESEGSTEGDEEEDINDNDYYSNDSDSYEDDSDSYFHQYVYQDGVGLDGFRNRPHYHISESEDEDAQEYLREGEDYDNSLNYMDEMSLNGQRTVEVNGHKAIIDPPGIYQPHGGTDLVHPMHVTGTGHAFDGIGGDAVTAEDAETLEDLAEERQAAGVDRGAVYRR